MQTIQDLIPKTYQQDLRNLFIYGDVNWYFHPGTAGISEEELKMAKVNSLADANTVERPQFSHSLCIDGKICSPHYSAVYPMLYFLEEHTGYRPQKILRIKANFLYKDALYPNNCYHEPHTDYYNNDWISVPKMSSLIYYVDDSDGDTFFFDQYLKDAGDRPNKFTVAHREHPRGGNAILFPSNQFHASSSPVVHDKRVVLNFVMFD
jgi:hypothetical protein